MIEDVILYVLYKYDATIYRISKIIDELFFAYIKTSSGTINPAIKRLENKGLIQCIEKMSDGGMLSKTYSITPEGRKYLVHSLISFENTNPYHVVNEAKIAFWCSEILSKEEYSEFKNNLLNYLELYKIKLERGLENTYITLSDKQKKTVEITKKELEDLINLL